MIKLRADLGAGEGRESGGYDEALEGGREGRIKRELEY